jgi:hypothetical protein
VLVKPTEPAEFSPEEAAKLDENGPEALDIFAKEMVSLSVNVSVYFPSTIIKFLVQVWATLHFCIKINFAIVIF